MTTRWLSKLQGSLFKILLTSFLLPKVKRILWSSKAWILKLFRTLHNGVKVLATTSILRALLVKNFAAIENSLTLSSLVRQHPGPSLPENVSLFQDYAKSSIAETALVFPKNLEKVPNKPSNNCVTPRKRQHLHIKDNQFYSTLAARLRVLTTNCQCPEKLESLSLCTWLNSNS